MKNIELKIQVENFGEIFKSLKKIRAKNEGILQQTDTYFNCAKGRLKLREENNKKFQLVFYKRPDTKGAKVSDFYIINFSKQQAQALKASLKKAYGEKVIVKKERRLWKHKNTRIHLDSIEKLGTFLELETYVCKNIKEACQEYNEVARLLNLSKYKKLDKSYSDMLMRKK